MHHDALRFVVARGDAAIAHREVLQLAFAALVADRAVERMVDQQELHHALLRLDRLLRVGAHLHAFGDRRRAGRQRLGRLLDLRPGTCGNWPRSTASCDSRNAECRCRACSPRPSPCCPFGTSHRPCRRFRCSSSAALRRHVTAPSTLVLDVMLELVAEMPDEALHRQRRRVAQRADRAARRCCRPPTSGQIQILLAALAVLDTVDHALQPAGSFAARRALPAGFLVVEIGQAHQRPHHAARVVHDDHRAGARASSPPWRSSRSPCRAPS